MSNGKQEADPDLSWRLESGVVDRFFGRRDMLVGLWAGEQLGLPEECRTIYALEVMAAGMMDPSPDAIVEKVAHDFTDQGILVTREEILVQLSKTHRLVAAGILAS